MDENSGAKYSYSIVPITANDKQTVANFLKKFFFRDEPLNVAIQLLEEIDSATKLEKYCIGYLKYGMTFMAVSQAGDIMGVILNNIMHRNEEEEEEEDDEDDNCNDNLKFKEIVVLLDKIKKEADVFEQYPNVNRILEIKIVTVNEAYRGQGVCKALVDKTKDYALKMGCQMIYVECTSHFSAKAVERLGFQCIYSLAYTDYVNEQGEMVFKTQSPHRYAKVYVLPL
ncbi:dopamine N-acetyltransferase-like isoform X2 [Sipha flava]|nr:dopamine N-acetyltransferase-like isoform X2 [Sipha flava]XP_025423943.1 dopamine N-acetyltransferase-like isoform X2 [Sipha flava]XP_025423944.1 dopamine N-acetyltransferase-like isoform X2 [Sipha flava]